MLFLSFVKHSPLISWDFYFLGENSPTHWELSWPHTIDPNYREVCFSENRGQHLSPLDHSSPTLCSLSHYSLLPMFSLYLICSLGLSLGKHRRDLIHGSISSSLARHQSNIVKSILRWETSEGSEPCVWCQAEVSFLFHSIQPFYLNHLTNHRSEPWFRGL